MRGEFGRDHPSDLKRDRKPDRALITGTARQRVRRLDATIHSGASDKPQANAVERQLGLLKAAFERGP